MFKNTTLLIILLFYSTSLCKCGTTEGIDFYISGANFNTTTNKKNKKRYVKYKQKNIKNVKCKY